MFICEMCGYNSGLSIYKQKDVYACIKVSFPSKAVFKRDTSQQNAPRS